MKYTYRRDEGYSPRGHKVRTSLETATNCASCPCEIDSYTRQATGRRAELYPAFCKCPREKRV